MSELTFFFRLPQTCLVHLRKMEYYHHRDRNNISPVILDESSTDYIKIEPEIDLITDVPYEKDLSSIDGSYGNRWFLNYDEDEVQEESLQNTVEPEIVVLDDDDDGTDECSGNDNSSTSKTSFTANGKFFADVQLA